MPGVSLLKGTGWGGVVHTFRGTIPSPRVYYVLAPAFPAT